MPGMSPVLGSDGQDCFEIGDNFWGAYWKRSGSPYGGTLGSSTGSGIFNYKELRMDLIHKYSPAGAETGSRLGRYNVPVMHSIPGLDTSSSRVHRHAEYSYTFGKLFALLTESSFSTSQSIPKFLLGHGFLNFSICLSSVTPTPSDSCSVLVFTLLTSLIPVVPKVKIPAAHCSDSQCKLTNPLTEFLASMLLSATGSPPPSLQARWSALAPRWAACSSPAATHHQPCSKPPESVKYAPSWKFPLGFSTDREFLLLPLPYAQNHCNQHRNYCWVVAV